MVDSGKNVCKAITEGAGPQCCAGVIFVNNINIRTKHPDVQLLILYCNNTSLLFRTRETAIYSKCHTLHNGRQQNLFHAASNLISEHKACRLLISVYICTDLCIFNNPNKSLNRNVQKQQTFNYRVTISQI